MGNTKEKIIAAARELFEKNGFAGTTTKEISQLAGISEVTLFRHFETKRNLFEQTVHSCMHPYKLKEYLQNDVQYDLQTDLTYIANTMMKTYQQNLPMLKMVFKDKMRGSESKLHVREHEHGAKGSLSNYFEEMSKLGRLKAQPKNATTFFITNITGFFMKDTFSSDGFKNDKAYFSWMIDQVIAVLKG
ncbi:MAG: TetR/AcrR family transcriptional regulator [Clostridia bacterium]|jgi:TetR/AcrR family transcriptional regulator, mexJK operon transcriptional repressor|nr:TetR/AcrR family transcriptional regulator [Clostridia bacterium]MBT7121920.1 TetR/AcrR family transcriptional regulator [Clostridia bacterium]